MTNVWTLLEGAAKESSIFPIRMSTMGDRQRVLREAGALPTPAWSLQIPIIIVVYRVDPGPNGLFDGDDDQVTSFDTLSFGLDDPEGITYNSDNGTLYVAGKPTDTLFVVTTEGALLQTIDISAAHAKKPSGLAYAPSSVDPNVMSVYIAARGVDNNSDPDENDGKVYEMLVPHPPVANDDIAFTNRNIPAILDILFNDNDVDGDPLSIASVMQGTNGTVTLNADNTVTYTPHPDFIGTDSFMYTITDGLLECRYFLWFICLHCWHCCLHRLYRLYILL